MEAMKLCPPETFSVINHNQKKLLAYNYWRQKEGYNIRKNGNFQALTPKGKDFMAA